MTTRSPTDLLRAHGPELTTWPSPDDRDGAREESIDEWWFLATKRSVAQARSMVRTRLTELGVAGDVVDNAVLVLSELATNAALHSRSAETLGSYLVRLCHGASMVRVEVRDAGGAARPRVQRHEAPSHLAENGRGLALVDHFATRWWTHGDEDGRTVCAELSLTG